MLLMGVFFFFWRGGGFGGLVFLGFRAFRA